MKSIIRIKFKSIYKYLCSQSKITKVYCINNTLTFSFAFSLKGFLNAKDQPE